MPGDGHGAEHLLLPPGPAEPAEPRRENDRALLEHIQRIWTASRFTYGSPRVHAQLAREGIRVGRKRVERLMNEAGMEGAHRSRYFRTTESDPSARVAPDLVDRAFHVEAPDQLWVADITYLYKYFPDVEPVLYAAHQRHVAGHLHHLTQLRDGGEDPVTRLEELGALLHRGDHVTRAQEQLSDLIEGVLHEVAAAGQLRDDVAPKELASYCLHASGAAGSLPSEAAVQRLVAVTLAGLQAQR